MVYMIALLTLVTLP